MKDVDISHVLRIADRVSTHAFHVLPCVVFGETGGNFAIYLPKSRHLGGVGGCCVQCLVVGGDYVGRGRIP